MNRIEHKNGNTFSYVEYSPLQKRAKMPLIMQLHGAGERGNGQDELARVDIHGFSELLKEKDYDCIVAMPQCPENTFWVARVESIVRFIEELIEKYDADPDRVYLTGLSMGGYGTWFTAMARPDLFAAIAPVCGGGMAWNAGVLKMPVWAFHGAEDTVVSPTQSDEMVAALRAIGGDVIYTRVDGVGHDVWENAYREELLLWLLSKTR